MPLSGRRYAKVIPAWRKIGYSVKLVFLELPTVEMAMARVAARVAQGGHNIPSETICRRFEAGRKNFHSLYKPLVDVWLHFDNAGVKPQLIDWSEV